MIVKYYILDTGIILGIIRGANYARYAMKKYRLKSANNIPLISIVTIGEIKSLAIKLKWGDNKLRELDTLLSEIVNVDINHKEIIDRYAEIDSFSQSKHPSITSDFTARNMGKNDIWIAATASVLEAILITTDKDFDHLNSQFLDVVYIDPNSEYNIELSDFM